MTRLRSCYFCGTTTGLSEYETLPDDLRESDASRRVVLCDRCHAKLTNVLAPVVERLGDGAGDGALGVGTRPDGTPDVGLEAAGPEPDTGSTADESPQTDVTFAGAVGDGDAPDASDGSATERRPGESQESTGPEGSGGAAEPAETPAAESAEPPAAAGPDESVEDADPDDEGVATDAVASDSESAGTGDEPGRTTGGTDATDTAAGRVDDADVTAEGALETTAKPATERTADDLDPVYHKLLRFLRNREFPIPRAEAEAVAQSAYDLSEGESTAVVQRAVDRAVLEERDGELYRT
jgi:hypothetical protein